DFLVSPPKNIHNQQPENYPSVTNEFDNNNHFTAIISTPNQSNEQIILLYLQQNQKINNIECQHLLNINHHQASYLLKKMNKNKQLKLEGKRRWAFYRCA
ncbi:MAG: hypothetical protein QM504_17280, partial [Pseudomonadota bacterium]